MVSILVTHVFTSFKTCVRLAEISRVRCVLFDLVLVVCLDDVVVVCHNLCCCCVHDVKGDILMPREIRVVCSGGLAEWNGGEDDVVCGCNVVFVVVFGIVVVVDIVVDLGEALVSFILWKKGPGCFGNMLSGLC